MSCVQSGVLLENCRAAIWLESTLTGDVHQIGAGCRRFIDGLKSLQQRFPDAQLVAVIAFGHDLWRKIGAPDSAPELKNFTPLGKGLAPATQHDVLIHILSMRHDVNFTLAQTALAAFGDILTVVEENHGFRWIEDRDLSGFVDGTENPHGEENRREVAVIQQGIDQGGSYVLTQRWQHNIAKFHRMSLNAQEMVIGRTKEDNQEIDGDLRPKTSHLSRVDLKEDGKGLKILRQSLPYGKASGVNGLYFNAYCARLHNIEQQLLSMFGESDGKRDDMLRFTVPVTGAYYFAPPLETLLSL